MPDGWAWIPQKRDRVIVEQAGKRHEIAKPAWFEGYIQVDASPDASRLAVLGWAASTSDTLRVDVVPTAGGTAETWSRSFAETGGVAWMRDGSLTFNVWLGTDAVTIHRLSGPGRVKTLGTVGHVATQLNLSRDGRRGAVMWREYRGDSWMYRVIKP